MASQLDLVVDPSEEVQLPTGMPAGEVTRAIESLARPRAERIGNEALGGDVGLVEVATRHTGASDVDLAHEPRRYRLEIRVQAVHPGSGNRLAELDRRVRLDPAGH